MALRPSGLILDKGERGAPEEIACKTVAGAFTSDSAQLVSLLANMTNAFVYGKVITDAKGAPVDIVYLDMNAAYERSIGKKKEDVVGRRATEVFPELANDVDRWLMHYARAALNGESSVFERHWPVDGKWYNVVVYGAREGTFVAIIEDIDERKRAEEALRKSEESYRHLLQYAPTGIFEVDYRGPRFKSVNDAMCEMSGYSREELLSMSPFDVLTPESALRFKERIKRGLSGLPIDDAVEYRAIRKDGGEACVLLNVKMTYVDGKLDGALVVGHDITERKRIEEQLRESAEKYSALFNNTSDGFWIHNLDGVIREVNDAYCRMSGYGRSELVGMPISDLEANEDSTEVAAHIRKVLEKGGHDRFESRHRRKDGSLFDVDITALYVKSEGGRMGVLVRDISHRKRLESELNAAMLRLYQILSSMSYGVLLVTSDDRVEYANQAFCDIFDLDEGPADLTGLSADSVIDKIRLSYEHPAAAVARIKQIVDLGEPVMGEDVPLIGERTYLRDFVPILIGDRPYGRLWVHMDITERKEMEMELRRSNAELQQFAYVCSHDLQEPLRMVTSYLGLLERHNKMEGKSREYMDYALEGASRMRELIDDLLAYSRVDSQGRRFEEVDMNQVLKRVLLNQKEFLEANHATVIDDGLLTVIADETQMVQILQNLVNNAVKFHGTRPPEVRISSEEQPVFWVFRVQDNGIGIPPQYRERVFEMFQRLHTRSEYDGTGIGLAISRRIAERHGGRIWVESDGSNGSTFCFTIAKGIKV